MRIRSMYAVMALLSMLSAPLQAAENELGWTLDSALKQVERQSQDFSSLLADVSVVRKGSDGRFRKIECCTGNCLACGPTSVPCGKTELTTTGPLKRRMLL